jgi:hypothetical protein
MRGNTRIAPFEALIVLAARDFGCLPDEIEDRLTDEQFHTWLEIRDQEARATEKARG